MLRTLHLHIVLLVATLPACVSSGAFRDYRANQEQLHTRREQARAEELALLQRELNALQEQVVSLQEQVRLLEAQLAQRAREQNAQQDSFRRQISDLNQMLQLRTDELEKLAAYVERRLAER